MPEPPDRWTRKSQQPPRTRVTVALVLGMVAMAILGPLAAIAVGAGSPGDGGSGIGTATTPSVATPGATTPAATTRPGQTAPTAAVPVCSSTAPSLGSTKPVTITTPAVTTTSPATVTITTPALTTTSPATTPPPAAALAPQARVAAATTTPATSTATPCQTSAAPATIPVPRGSPFASSGMWIWQMSNTDGGNVPRIGAQAKEFGVGTVLIKAGDGTTWWQQFNPGTIGTLHAWGLHVCAWQFVYGLHPVLEAGIGARAVKDGADCLVIDAESQYQGLYVQAQKYLSALRTQIGAQFPVALAGFPFVDLHPSFPYSVFLGPSGAQYNAPQMYWRDIGTTVSGVYAHTYAFNELYQRPIFPLGQVFDAPPSSQINQFRAVATYYGATGVSWWDWQSAGSSQFQAIWSPIGSIVGFLPQTTVASIGRGAKGDVVVWAQEHLVKAGQRITVDGDFGARTQRAVTRFQAAHRLPANGVITPATWNALLHYQPLAVRWTATKRSLTAAVARAGAQTRPVPASASLRAKRNELGGNPGQGSPATASR